MINSSHVFPKRPPGRPPGPALTDAFREKILFGVIASAARGPGVPLKPLVRLVIDANDGPHDAREYRRVYERFRRSHFEQPQQYDRARHLDAPIGTWVRMRADSPDWEHVEWEGWFPVKRLADDEWILERQLRRLLTQEEGEEQATKEFERMLIGMGPIGCCDALA